jgi:PAS domain S-box-containing protein
MPQSQPLALEEALASELDTDSLAEQTDLRQRQRAVILAYSRRSVGRGEPTKLMLDAASLIGETLQIRLQGTVDRVDVADQWRLQIRVPGGGPDPLEHRYSVGAQDSLVAYAIDKGQPVACTDLTTDTRFKDLFLRHNGIVGALVLPLRLDGRNFGAIGLFSNEPHEFTTDDIEFADTIAHLLISTIARVEVAQLLTAERQVLSTLLDTSESIVIMTDLEGRVTRVNSAGERLTGYTVEEFARRPLWNVIATPAELQLVRKNFRQGLESGQATAYESDLLTKQGGRLRIRWSQSAMLDEHNAPRSMVLTGIDITEFTRLEHELADGRGSKEPVAPQAVAPPTEAATPKPAKAVAAEQFAALAAFQMMDDAEHASKRTSPRRAYPYRQSVAPIYNGKLPTKDDFIQVQFRDISAGGVSFLINRRPEFDSFVLELGCEPNVHYMSAKVVNVIERATGEGSTFMVGCRFLNRVHL